MRPRANAILILVFIGSLFPIIYNPEYDLSFKTETISILGGK